MIRKEDRPSTAPSKEKNKPVTYNSSTYSSKFLSNPHQSINRVPSPNTKCNVNSYIIKIYIIKQ